MSLVVTRQPQPWDGFGVATQRQISSPPSAVWTAITDIDSYPSVLSTVLSTERIGSRRGDSLKVGTRWRENRSIDGGEGTFGSTITCTAINDGGGDSGGSSSAPEYPKSISIITDIPATTSTGTLTVERIDDDTARLVVSFAMAPTGFGSKVFTTIFGRLINKFAIRHVQIDMDDIAAACEGGALNCTAT